MSTKDTNNGVPAPFLKRLFQDAKPSFPLLVILTILSLFFVGYQYGSNDSAYYLIHIRHRMDPSFLANDWYTSQVWEPHPVFLWFLSKIATWASLPYAFFTLHVLERFCTLLGIYLLSFTLFRSLLGAYLSILIIILMNLKYGWPLGGNDLLYSSTIPHTLGISIAFYAFMAFFGERRRSAALLLGIATNIHLLIGLNLAFVFFGYWIIDRKGQFQRNVLLPFLLYSATASITIVPIAYYQLHTLKASPLSTQDYINIIGFFRAPHHYIASSWPPIVLLTFFAYFLFGQFTAMYPPSAGLHRKVKYLVLSFLGLAVLAILFVEIIPSSIVLKLQFFRLMIFVKLLVSLYIANFMAVGLQSSEKFWQLIGIALLFKLRDPIFLALVGFVSSLREWKATKNASRLWQASLFIFCLAGLVWVQKADMLLKPFSVPTNLLFTISACLLLLWLWNSYGKRMAKTARPFKLTLAFGLLAALFPSLVVVNKMFDEQKFSFSVTGEALSQRIHLTLSDDTEWSRLCEWVRSNTSTSATFIIPLQSEDFRLRAERAVVVDFKSIPMNEAQTLEWWERIRRFLKVDAPPWVKDYDTDFLDTSYVALTSHDFLEIGRLYGATHIITPRRMALPFHAIHSSGEYTVYSLSDEDPAHL